MPDQDPNLPSNDPDAFLDALLPSGNDPAQLSDAPDEEPEEGQEPDEEGEEETEETEDIDQTIEEAKEKGEPAWFRDRMKRYKRYRNQRDRALNEVDQLKSELERERRERQTLTQQFERFTKGLESADYGSSMNEDPKEVARKIVQEEVQKLRSASDFQARQMQGYQQAVELYPDLQDQGSEHYHLTAAIWKEACEQARSGTPTIAHLEDGLQLAAERADAMLRAQERLQGAKAQKQTRKQRATHKRAAQLEAGTPGGQDFADIRKAALRTMKTTKSASKAERARDKFLDQFADYSVPPEYRVGG